MPKSNIVGRAIDNIRGQQEKPQKYPKLPALVFKGGKWQVQRRSAVTRLVERLQREGKPKDPKKRRIAEEQYRDAVAALAGAKKLRSPVGRFNPNPFHKRPRK